jgi:hypothetical protein
MPAHLRKRILWLVVVLAVLAVLGYHAWEFLMVDRCLDAGGLWDYKSKTCDTTPEP